MWLAQEVPVGSPLEGYIHVREHAPGRPGAVSLPLTTDPYAYGREAA